MSRQRRTATMLRAPMAVASDRTVLVNVAQLASGAGLDDVLAYAEATGLPIFIGLAVPARLHKRFVREFDDAAADVVGRLGPLLTAAASRGSASSPSSEGPRRGGRGRSEAPPQRRRGRPREP